MTIMYCLYQRLKWMFFEIFSSGDRVTKVGYPYPEWRKKFQKKRWFQSLRKTCNHPQNTHLKLELLLWLRSLWSIKNFLFIMSYISYFCFTLGTSEALLISYFSTLHFYFSTLHFHFSTLSFYFSTLLFEPNPKFHWNSDLMQVQGMGDTLPSVFSIIKKIWIFLPEFLPQGGIEPGSPNPQTSV